jgi:thiosulfate/3-mercaptopyruvate sulfurtransferase
MRSRIPIAGIALFALMAASSVFAQGVVARSDMIVTTDWLAERVDGHVTVLHVGTAEEYAQTHIPGARLLKPTDILTDQNGIPNELPEVAELEQVFTSLGAGGKERIVLYSSDPLVATRAWFTLDYLGHGHRSSVLNGGIARWKAEDRPLTTEAARFEPVAFEASPNAAALTIHRAMKPLVRYRSDAPVKSDVAVKRPS